MKSVTAYTADGQAITLYATPPIATQQTQITPPTIPGVESILSMTKPGERVTVSFSVERTSQAIAEPAKEKTVETQAHPDGGKALIMAIAAVALLIGISKAVEAIAAHPIEFIIMAIAGGCLLAAWALAKGGRS